MILGVAFAFALDVAAVLRTDPAKVSAAQAGVELLYARRLPEAKVAFDTLSVRYPTSGLGPLGLSILYQQQMFENDDFRFEGAYGQARDATRAQVAQGAAAPGDEALENFVLASVLGIDAIHLLRRHRYVTAFARAYDGLRALERCEAAAPEFVDPVLGDGMFLYWRTLVSERSTLIPDFSDRRAEGIERMQAAESGATFLGPGASLALAYAWMGEGRADLALAQTERIAARYPDNVLNQLMRYEVLLHLQRYTEAWSVVEHLDAAAVPRVWFHRGVALGRLGRWPEAARAYRAWLASPPAEAEQVTQAWYRIGDAELRSGHPDAARVALGVASGRGHKPARQALSRMDFP